MELISLSLFWMISSVLIFLLHIILTARDGKIIPDILKAAYLWGKLKMNNKIDSKTLLPIPKSWFTHFYGFGLVVHSLVFAFLLAHLADGKSHFLFAKEDFWGLLRFPATNVKEKNALPVVMVFTMEWIQIARRLYECLFTSSFSKGTMSPIHYFYGMFLYSSFGIGLLASVDVSNLKFTDSLKDVDVILLLPVVFLFFWASYFQHKSFQTFASLRKVEKKGKPAKGHYIPRGHLFEWVSCPHYLCEIIIYTSLCLVFRMNSMYLNSVLAFVVVNQISSSLLSHEWYKTTFVKYPKNRKAVIPYVL